jgi:hypothetical protein
MPVYWEQIASGVQVENFNSKEDDEDYEIQKPKMNNVEDEKQIKDLVMNTK